MNNLDSPTESALVAQAHTLVTPGRLTHGNTKRVLELCKRYSLTGTLTTKQYDELKLLVAKGNDNG